MKILNEADTQPIGMETSEKSLMSHDILPCATLLVQDVRNKNRVTEKERMDARDANILSSVQRTCAALKIQAVYRAFLGRSRLTMRDGRQTTHTVSLPRQPSFVHSRPFFSSLSRPAKLERQISDVTMSDFGESTHHQRLGFSSHFACPWIAEGDGDHDNDDDDEFCLPAANDKCSDVMSNRLVLDVDNTNYPNDVDARSNGIRDPFLRDEHSAPASFKLERTPFCRTLNPHDPSDIQELAVSILDQSSVSRHVTEQATPPTTFDTRCQGPSRRQRLKDEVGGVGQVGNVSVPGTNYKIDHEEELSVRLLNQSYDNVNCPRSDVRQNSGTIQNVKGNRISPSRSRMSSNRSTISKSRMDSRSIGSSYSSRPQQEQEQEQERFIFPDAKKSTFPSSQKGKGVEESGSIHNSLNSIFSSTMSMKSSPMMPLRKVSSHNDAPTSADGYNNSVHSSKSMIRPSPPSIRQTERSIGTCRNGSEYSPKLPIRKESTHGSTVDTNSHHSFYTATTSSFDHPWGPCNNTVEMPSSRLSISHQEYPIRQPQRRASLFQCPHASTNDDVNTTTDHSQSYDSNVFADEEILCTSFE